MSTLLNRKGLVAGILLASLWASSALASPAATLAPVAPVVPCAQLAKADLSHAVGSAVSIAGAVVRTGPHDYCEVTGTIARAVHFEVRLPQAGWTQRYLQTGCGGLCGMLRINPEKSEGCAPVTDGSIVLASTDMGHQGQDGAWGENPDQRIDFAWRGVHETALVAKALIKAFYGRPQRYAYFSGCSDGGREALMEAQRFPEDFDGIAAGAPALNFTVQNSFHHGWLAKVVTGPDGRPLLTAIDMQPLHAGVLKACDGLDGLVDGQISDPRACHFDPAVLTCAGAYQPGQCLTTAQVAAVRRIYEGARTADGKRLEVGPLMRGSELEWVGVFVPSDKDGRIGSEGMALGTINHLLFTPNPSYTIATFPFTQAEYAAEEPARALYSADNPDLAPFVAHGGKLILWHGWSDPHISPLNTIDYYERVGRVLGASRRDASVRLFLFPGMGHCGGGDGPDEFPLLASLMAWVEGAPAPSVLIAHRGKPSLPPMAGPGPHRDGAGPPPDVLAAMRQAAERAAKLGPRSRPVYAYPDIAHYRGSGSIDDAANFVSFTPPHVEGIEDWVGSR